MLKIAQQMSELPVNESEFIKCEEVLNKLENEVETLSITDRAYLLFEGKILRQGTAEELASDELVRKVYLGQHFELKRKV
jgi:ABC-type uncharacterized transport system ATPase subunit